MKEENIIPNYYAVIPAEVRYADITPNAKLLYGEITALCNKEGFCWATNKYFADLYKVDTRSISEWIRQLKDCDFIKYEIEDDYRRKIFLVGVSRNLLGGMNKSSKGVRGKLLHNNTMNNTMNNKGFSNKAGDNLGLGSCGLPTIASIKKRAGVK